MIKENWSKFKINSKKRSNGNYFPFIMKLKNSIDPQKKEMKWKGK
jgi:hypothetical protein